MAVQFDPDIDVIETTFPPNYWYEGAGRGQLALPIPEEPPTDSFAWVKELVEKFRQKPKLVWRIVFLVALAICFAIALYQVVMILQIFFEYPITVSVDIGQKSNLTLPGVTFCSSIGVRRSELSKMPGFKMAVERQNKDDEKKKLQATLDNYYNKYIATTNVNELIFKGLNITEFLVVPKTKCALDEVHLNESNHVQRILCRNYVAKDYFETFQGTYMCFTLFHEATTSRLSEVPVPSGFTQSMSLIVDDSETDGREDDTIQPLEIIRFIVNFTGEESTNLDNPPSGTVAVHDLDIVRSGRLQSHFITPGHFYEIFIDIQESYLLEAPYPTRCHAYREQNLHFYQEPGLDPHPFFDAPLSSADCITGCLGRISINSTCACWPPEIPYLKGDVQKKFTDDLILCDWMKLGKKLFTNDSTSSGKEKALMVFHHCFSRHKEFCEQKCHSECIRTRIKTSVQSMEWPSDERIRFANETQQIKLNELRNCCAVVSIRMASEDVTVYTYSAKYEPIEFVSYVGGIISLWVGFTFIGIVDYLKDVIKLVRVFVLRQGNLDDDDDEEASPAEVTQQASTGGPPPPYGGSLDMATAPKVTDKRSSFPWYMECNTDYSKRTSTVRRPSVWTMENYRRYIAMTRSLRNQ